MSDSSNTLSTSVTDSVNNKALELMKYYYNDEEVKNIKEFEEIRDDLLEYLFSFKENDIIKVLSEIKNLKYRKCMPVSVDIFIRSENENVCSWLVKNRKLKEKYSYELQEYLEYSDIPEWKYNLVNKWIFSDDE